MTLAPSPNVNRRHALIDLTLVIGVLLALKFLLLKSDAIWSYAGPISLLASIAVATWCLWRRRENWSSLGLRRPISFSWVLRLTVVALVLTIAVDFFAIGLAESLLGPPNDAVQAIDTRFLERFASVPGNLQAYLFWVAIAWIIGGFVEEMLYRGFLFTRFETLFGGVPQAAIIAAFCQAMLFGYQHHYYQGFNGWIVTGAIGLASGILYLAFKRNLWPLIMSHGLSNTIGLTLLYLGLTG